MSSLRGQTAFQKTPRVFWWMPLAIAINYFAAIGKGKAVLWCYLIWYLVTVYLRFDASPGIWLNSIGISAVIGVGLLLSVFNGGRVERWQTFRLFLMPFCVSSFSSLIKGQGYLFIFPSKQDELVLSLTACAGFIVLVVIIKMLTSSKIRI